VIEIFQRVETLISLAKFLASMYFHEVVHFPVHGVEIFLGNLGGIVKFLPPGNSITYPGNSGCRKFRPRARISTPSG
jgi:hypothetical protein